MPGFAQLVSGHIMEFYSPGGQKQWEIEQRYKVQIELNILKKIKQGTGMGWSVSAFRGVLLEEVASELTTR